MTPVLRRVVLLAAGVLSAAGAAGVRAGEGPLELVTFQSDPPRMPELEVAFRGPSKASSPWRLCVVLPNVSDSYWDWVVEGLNLEAGRLGVTVSVFEASGYDASGLEQQKRILVSRCIGGRYDAILLAAIDDRALAAPLAEARKAGLKIVDLINGYEDASVDTHAVMDFLHLGAQTGKAVRELAAKKLTAGAAKVRVFWAPGPMSATWARRGDEGFVAALSGLDGLEVETRYGPPFDRVQAGLLKNAVAEGGAFDIVAGTAPTAVAAAAMRESGEMAPDTPIISYYGTPAVLELYDGGKVTAVGTDEPVLQARIGVALAVMLLEGQPVSRYVGPKPRLMRQGDR